MEIKPEFQELMPPLTDEEYAQLKKNIIEQGYRADEPILLWHGFVIDGHNRMSICKELGITPLTLEMEFVDEEAVKLWIIDNQLGRRNLSPYVKGELGLAKEPIYDRMAEDNLKLSKGRGKKGLNNSSNLIIPVHVDEAIAKDTGLSHVTIQRVRYIRDNANEDVKRRLRSGEESVNRAFTKLKLDEETKLHEFEPLVEKTSEIPVRCKKGDLWIMDEHRLLCGDATHAASMSMLIGMDKVSLVFTDPPYGLDIVNGGNSDITAKTGFVGTKGIVRAKRYKEVIGDATPFDPTWLLDKSQTIILFGANNYASKLPDSAHWLVWDKKVEKGADNNFFSDVELMWTNVPKKGCRIYRHLWSGMMREGERRLELNERVHPTQKPVELLMHILLDYSDEGDIVLDPYSGSGSMLIACEELKRKCYMCEIDERYCDAILQRWENLTGKKAVKEDGL